MAETKIKQKEITKIEINKKECKIYNLIYYIF